jgi:hypothetical protein
MNSILIGQIAEQGSFLMIAQFVTSFPDYASKHRIVDFFLSKTGHCIDSMRQNGFGTKIFINSKNNQKLTLSGRRWIDHGSSKEGSGKEAGSKETRSKESSGEEEVIFFLKFTLTFFS